MRGCNLDLGGRRCGFFAVQRRSVAISLPAPPPGQTYHSKKPGRTPEGDLKSTQPDSGKTAAPQRRAGPPSREPLTTGG